MPADTAAAGADGARGDFPGAFYAVIKWIDSFHTGTAVLLSEGEPGASDAISVLTSYGDDATLRQRLFGQGDRLPASHAAARWRR